MARGSRVRTIARREAVLLALRGGATKAQAARHAGMSDESLRLWTVDSKLMREDVEQAINGYILGLVAQATRDARTNPGSALKMLERHPYTRAEWGPKADPPPTVDVHVDNRQVHLTAGTNGADVPRLAAGTDPLAQLRQLTATLDVLVSVGALQPPGQEWVEKMVPPKDVTPMLESGE